MSILSKLFGRSKIVVDTTNTKISEESTATGSTKEYEESRSFLKEIEDLTNQDIYLARRSYRDIVKNHLDSYSFFSAQMRAGILDFYCEKYSISQDKIKEFTDTYESFSEALASNEGEPKLIKEHNQDFLNRHLRNEKDYLDNILAIVDRKIKLDDEQRQVVLSDEDYTLVVAGAGAGKTTTLAAKVRYLVEQKGIGPEDILVISFTNKAVGELKEKINDALGIECPVTTFHSIGYTILKSNDAERKVIVDQGFLYDTVNKYLKERILTQPELVDKLILFFGSYFDAPYEGEDLNTFFNYITKGDFTTLKSNVGEYTAKMIDTRTMKTTTIKHEKVRSAQEVQIANYLYMNGIDYEYEKVYPYNFLKSNKPYTPDFTITQNGRTAYIEHFGITEDGKNNRYSYQELEKYKKEVKDKIQFHKDHKTSLIFTFSGYRDGRSLLEHLDEKLVKAGFTLTKRSSQEVYEKIVNTEENKYISRLVNLIITFIGNFKTNGYGSSEFDIMNRKTRNVRTKLFLDICQECYLEYARRLKERGAVDFEDMINDSARILTDKYRRGEHLNYKYIIVDEYQDISHQRFDLTKELSKICNAKIIAVGDDWQSIYAYAGSDITLFTQFAQSYGYAKQLKITRTYRNAQEVIDIAGCFIQRNDSQLKKSLISPKRIERPVIVQTYNENPTKEEREQLAGPEGKLAKGGKYLLLGKAIENAIDDIRLSWKGKGSPSILLIGRYGFDARNLCFSQDFNYDEKSGKVISKKYPRARLEYLTAHRSKGLGYDEVIIVNARDELFGFPAQLEDDPVLKLVTVSDNSIEYAEERRLFYVALTRTKNRIYIITPQQRPSVFVRELVKDYPNIEVNGTLDAQDAHKDKSGKKMCPICGYPLQHRFRQNYGLNLWVCTNDPEVCDFMTNDTAGGKLSVLKCDCCKDGYLIIKRASGAPFLGCTNYNHEGTGCKRTMTLADYEKFVNDGFSYDTSSVKQAYLKVTPTHLPELVAPKEQPAETRPRKKSNVNTTQRKFEKLENDGFQMITTDDGQLVTDVELLSHLRSLRARIAKDAGKAAFMIVSNKGLVSLATFRPQNKQDFVSLEGLGEKTYHGYGLDFINAIKSFDEK